VTSVRAADLVSKLALQPHPEGGWYREIYRSATRVESARGSRSALTTIYYLLEQNQLSRWHVVQADELWHFYAGAPLELLGYDPAGRELTRSVLGNVDQATGATGVAGAAGNAPPTSVAVIPTQVWQAARSLGEYSLVGCTVGPGFEFADFQFVADLAAHAAHFKGELAPFTDLL
jgi:predicted cupin superfamily sugar epimerase